MATWIAHLRLAQNLLDAGYRLDPSMFVVGNLSPDCGFPDENGNFIPSPHVTHFRTGNSAADPRRFYDLYLKNRQYNDAQYAFMLGYYTHLYADLEWVLTIYRPKKASPLWAEGLELDPEFIWEIKKDWYGIDFLYLEENPQSLFYTTLLPVERVPDYLDFVPCGRLSENIERIQQYYQDENSFEAAHERRYIYLKPEEVNAYVAETTTKLLDDLAAKGICPA